MGSVFLTDIDDYLHPSQACINPLFESKNDTSTTTTKNNPNTTTTAITIDAQQQSTAMTTTTTLNNDNSHTITSTNETPIIVAGSNTNGRVIPRRRIKKRQKPTRVVINSTSSDNNNNKNNNNNNTSHIIPSISSFPLDEPTLTTTIPTKTTTISKKSSTTKATVSVADCLACSGCITSAEAVLVTRHSLPELRRRCRPSSESPNTATTTTKRTAFTISSASIADVARHFCCHDEYSFGNDDMLYGRVFRTISHLLHEELGADIVIDGDVMARISLIETCGDFVDRYRHCTANGDGPVAATTPPLPSIARSATCTILPSTNSSHPATTLHHPPGRNDDMSFYPLPLLTSSCPGFVCHVEKTTPGIIPHLSSAKSPMAVSGTFCKRLIPEGMMVKQNNDDDDDDGGSNRRRLPSFGGIGNSYDDTSENVIYHVSIMPCHDKKLEASRRDLAWEKVLNGVSMGGAIATPQDEDEDLEHDVDLVITTGELNDLIGDMARERGWCKEGEEEEEGVRNYFLNEMEGVMKRRRGEEGGGPVMIYDYQSHISDDDGGGGAMNNNGINDVEMTDTNNDAPSTTPSSSSSSSPAVGSGGYADYIFREASRELFHYDIPSNDPLPWRPVSHHHVSPSSSSSVIRRRRPRRINEDFQEVCLYRHSDGTYSTGTETTTTSNGTVVEEEDENSNVVLRFAAVYGFRNVQSLVKTISPSSSIITSSSSSRRKTYHFVEVMACPSGCLNGGGQLRGGVVNNNNNSSSINEKSSSSNGNVEEQKSTTAIVTKETPTERRERVGQARLILEQWKKQSSIIDDRDKTIVTLFYGNDDDNDNNNDYGDGAYHSSSKGIFTCGRFGENARRMLHTRFHAVPKLEMSLGMTKGLALGDTKW